MEPQQIRHYPEMQDMSTATDLFQKSEVAHARDSSECASDRGSKCRRLSSSINFESHNHGHNINHNHNIINNTNHNNSSDPINKENQDTKARSQVKVKSVSSSCSEATLTQDLRPPIVTTVTTHHHETQKLTNSGQQRSRPRPTAILPSRHSARLRNNKPEPSTPSSNSSTNLQISKSTQIDTTNHKKNRNESLTQKEELDDHLRSQKDLRRSTRLQKRRIEDLPGPSGSSTVASNSNSSSIQTSENSRHDHHHNHQMTPNSGTSTRDLHRHTEIENRLVATHTAQPAQTIRQSERRRTTRSTLTDTLTDSSSQRVNTAASTHNEPNSRQMTHNPTAINNNILDTNTSQRETQTHPRTLHGTHTGSAMTQVESGNGHESVHVTDHGYGSYEDRQPIGHSHGTNQRVTRNLLRSGEVSDPDIDMEIFDTHAKIRLGTLNLTVSMFTQQIIQFKFCNSKSLLNLNEANSSRDQDISQGLPLPDQIEQVLRELAQQKDRQYTINDLIKTFNQLQDQVPSHPISLIIISILISLNNAGPKYDIHLIADIYGKRDAKYLRESLNINPTKDDCPICLSALYQNYPIAVLENCQHAFHKKCLSTWHQQKFSCPLCRTSLSNLKICLEYKNSYI